MLGNQNARRRRGDIAKYEKLRFFCGRENGQQIKARGLWPLRVLL